MLYINDNQETRETERAGWVILLSTVPVHSTSSQQVDIFVQIRVKIKNMENYLQGYNIKIENRRFYTILYNGNVTILSQIMGRKNGAL